MALPRLNGPLPRTQAVTDTDAVIYELEAIRQGIDDLVTILAGETVIVEWIARLGTVAQAPARNPVDAVTADDEPWHSVLVENPNAQPIFLGFAAGAGRPGAAHHVIPAQRAVMLTRPYTDLSIGFDPANAPANPLLVTVTQYRRPQPVTGWTLA